MAVLEFLGSSSRRWVRIVAGLVLAVGGGLLGGAWWILAAVGLVVFAAGTFDFCLLAALVRRPVNGAAFRASCAR
jgi:hypothetical protein